MKLSRKSLPTLLWLIAVGAIAGSLAWEIVERILSAAGLTLSMTTDPPLQLFDLYVLAVSVRFNPGTLAGAVAGALLFRAV